MHSSASIPTVPKLSDRFNVIPTGDGQIGLHSLTDSAMIDTKDSRLFDRLLPLLNGHYDVPAIIAQISEFDELVVLGALKELACKGVLEDATKGLPSWLSEEEFRRYRMQVTLLSHFPKSIAEAQLGEANQNQDFVYQERLKNATVLILGCGRLGSNLCRSLSLTGVGHIKAVDPEPVTLEDVAAGGWFVEDDIGTCRVHAVSQGIARTNRHTCFAACTDEIRSFLEVPVAGPMVMVLATDDFVPSLYGAANKYCLREHVAWTSVRLLGFEMTLGPSILPGETPCYTCFDRRLESNIPSYEDHLAFKAFLEKSRWRSGSFNVTFGTELAALEVIKIITGFHQARTYAHIFVLNVLTLQSKLHPLLKVPTCPDCGVIRKAMPRIAAWQDENQ